MTNLDSYINLFKQINSDTTLLTPNRRLSATLHKLYQHYQLDQEKNVWHTPDILPVSSWIQRLWNNYISTEFSAAPLLLNSVQEQFLWEKILLSAKESTVLLQVSETADIAKTAWNLLKQWQIDVDSSIFKCAEDYAALHEWAMRFISICREKNWVEIASLPDIIARKIKANEIKSNKNIFLIGFTELSPQLKYLLTCCEETGICVHHFEPHQSLNECVRISLPDEENEILAAARWAKSISAKNKSATIGCVIPSLDKKRDRVQQLFSEVFSVDHACIAGQQDAKFNISAGKSLLQYPIIYTALQLLSLNKKSISIELMSYLLGSPFLGDAESERIRRAHFDSLLRQKNMISVDLIKLVQKTEDNKQLSLEKSCPQLAKRIQQFLLQLKENEKLHYSEWAKLFTELLSLLGWPGERSLNSDEYQIVENWLQLLSDYATLDHVAKPATFQQALQHLHKITGKALFQPKTPDAPIQILGILEAAALPFDYLWVAGMDDLSWPPQPKPNPLIPKRLQRELNMPHATAERELMFCQLLTKQFKQSASHIIFSHAEKNEELELQASPLIRHFKPIKLEMLDLDDYQPPSKCIHTAKAIETLLDEIAPAHTGQEKVHGGVSVIKQQALCPFKAFAEWRLHAHELEKTLPGLRAKDRGKLLHKSLEILWDKLKDQATLNAMQEGELNSLITDSINTAFDTTSSSHRDYTQYISLEKQRLHKLIRDWLQIEKERTPFTVATNEKLAEITLNQLSFSVRIDRIDELPDGKKLIIDYKTGKNNDIGSWFSDRPEEPQLPLYALIDQKNTVGITFAQVASGESCFKGLSQYSLDIKGVKLISEIKKTTALSWSEQLRQWNTILTKLSDDFHQGIANVDPKDSEKTCLWCALKPLCRINEEMTIQYDN